MAGFGLGFAFGFGPAAANQADPVLGLPGDLNGD